MFLINAPSLLKINFLPLINLFTSFLLAEMPANSSIAVFLPIKNLLNLLSQNLVMDFNAYNHLSQTILRIIVALVIVILGLIFGSFFSKLAKKILEDLECDRILKKEAKISLLSFEHSLPKLVKYFVYFIALLFALQALGIVNAFVYAVLALLILVVAAVLLLSMRDCLPDLIAGFRIHRKKSFRIGDHLVMGSTSGEIVDFTRTDIKILTKKKELFIIPNSLFLKNEFRIIRK